MSQKTQLFSDPGFKLTNLAPVPTKYLCQIKSKSEKFLDLVLIWPKYLWCPGAQLVNLNPGSEKSCVFLGHPRGQCTPLHMGLKCDMDILIFALKRRLFVIGSPILLLHFPENDGLGHTLKGYTRLPP